MKRKSLTPVTGLSNAITLMTVLEAVLRKSNYQIISKEEISFEINKLTNIHLEEKTESEFIANLTATGFIASIRDGYYKLTIVGMDYLKKLLKMEKELKEIFLTSFCANLNGVTELLGLLKGIERIEESELLDRWKGVFTNEDWKEDTWKKQLDARKKWLVAIGLLEINKSTITINRII